jgi:hypothetical protein
MYPRVVPSPDRNGRDFIRYGLSNFANLAPGRAARLNAILAQVADDKAF